MFCIFLMGFKCVLTYYALWNIFITFLTFFACGNCVFLLSLVVSFCGVFKHVSIIKYFTTLLALFVNFTMFCVLNVFHCIVFDTFLIIDCILYNLIFTY